MSTPSLYKVDIEPLVAGIKLFSVILQGSYAGPCFIACIVFSYLAVSSYRKWKTEDKDQRR